MKCSIYDFKNAQMLHFHIATLQLGSCSLLSMASYLIQWSFQKCSSAWVKTWFWYSEKFADSFCETLLPLVI